MKDLPIYKLVYETLRKDIAGGRYRAGDILPSENELCEEFNTTRPTVRKAVQALVDEGMVMKHHGKGSIVKGAPKGIGILSLSGTTTAVGKELLKTKIIVKPDHREWTEAFSFHITRDERNSGCIYFERLREMNGSPMFFDITMLQDKGLPGFYDLDLENESLFDSLRKNYRITVTGGTQQLFAIKADKRLSDFFHTTPGSPVLQLNRRIETTREDFFIYSQVFCVTQGYGLTVTF
ncbi:MAG: GntR family transcriptional regulator [Rikenellaceae bacterium]|nr:GntR family transcriptional regulator [Rikenellaceae bacterium]